MKDEDIDKNFTKNSSGLYIPDRAFLDDISTQDDIEKQVYSLAGKPVVIRKMKVPNETIGGNVEIYIYHTQTKPYGKLPKDFAAHALMNYALTASYLIQYNLENRLQYEGEKDLIMNFKALFKSTAVRYSVEPERMSRFWFPVNAEFLKLFGRKLEKPVLDAEKFNFDQFVETNKHLKGL